ncbi:MAG TPA: response regulator, partial [Thermoleophilia bacterium]|nr:response regulator [Thermoleophilia bacterium]
QYITEQRDSEDALRESERRSAVRNRIAQVFLTAGGQGDGVVFVRVRDVILEAVQSRYGILGYVDGGGSWVCPGVAADPPLESGTPRGDLVLAGREWSGVWGRAMRERRTVVETGVVETPGGSRVRRALDMPIISGEQLLGNILIGDRDAEFAEKDVRFVESVAEYLAPIFHARLQLAEQERASRQLQDQLQQAQKMEAIGRLAGGVAHDFNNMLGVILGYGETLLEGLPDGDPLRDYVVEMVAAGERSATMTRQLLAFSRTQTLRPEVVDLNAVVEGSVRLLRRVIGEDVTLEFVPAATPVPVRLDAGRWEQVLMNLAVNARDAMRGGGTLTIEVKIVEFDASSALANLGIEPGYYAVLDIADTGCGMDSATEARVFEPYFTTKESGRGTGLGLSSVYGTVEQSGGTIWVHSEVGRGTTFTIHLPMAEATIAIRPAEAPVERRPRVGRGELVLVVEDEDPLRRLVQAILLRLGYTVAVAANGNEAVELVEGAELKPELVITDVVMPGMNGVALAKRLRKTLPDLKVIFMSGYTDAEIASSLDVDARWWSFISKPFTKEALAGTIEAILRDEDDPVPGVPSTE